MENQQPATTGNPKMITLGNVTITTLGNLDKWICPGCNHTYINVRYDPVCFHCADPLGTDVWKQYIDYKDQPHGWIQWKGSNVCMDIHCKCGAHMHIDADFTYYVECPYCNTVYSCDPNIHFVELTEAQAEEARKLTGAIRTPDKNEDDIEY